ncbi:MAG: OAM dimerization domain-containing protein [Polyangiales bacterium]
MHPTEPKLVKAYGDREGDGMVQLTFTLPLPKGAKAREAAKRFAENHGLREPLVTTMEECAEGYTYFITYGHSQHTVDIANLEVPEVEVPRLDMKEVDHRIATRLGRKIVVVGACTGSDAHTVGIDAILNMKGYAGEKGLEAYKYFDAHNLGAQVENDQLVERAQALNADAILVSQVITQRNCHKENGRALVEMLEKRGLRKKFLLLFGGPRVDHKLGLELGFDAGFGPGTRPGDVASFLVQKLCGDEVVVVA